MNGALNVRDEIRELINIMPERKLHALRPLLGVLVDDDDDTLSDEDLALFQECEKDCVERPESFASWRTIRRES